MCIRDRIQGVAGIKDVYLSNLYKSGVRQGYQMNQEVIDGRWYEGRTDASYPRLLDYSDTRNEQYSDFWVASKAYLKIRNITLGYTLPSQWTKVAYMDSCLLYTSWGASRKRVDNDLAACTITSL